VLSISLELPEFEVIKQLSFSNQYFVHVQKSHEELTREIRLWLRTAPTLSAG